MVERRGWCALMDIWKGFPGCCAYVSGFCMMCGKAMMAEWRRMVMQRRVAKITCEKHIGDASS